MVDFSLILPVFNEAEIIKPVVDDLEKYIKKMHVTYEVILVENESSDNTLKVLQSMAAKNLHLVVVEAKNGYGSAIIAGINQARGKYACYMPSDGQIDASVLITLWQKINSETYDIVKIYRKNRESTIRYIRSKIFNYLTKVLYPINVRDINGSPRILKRKLLEKIDLFHPDSFIDTEFTVKASLMGLRTLEIPMQNLARVGGKSTVSIHTVIEFLVNLYNFRIDPRFINWKKTNL